MAEDPAAAGVPNRLRVFFALWPDAATAAALHARGRGLQASCGGRVMRRDTIHLTLAFLGDVDTARIDCLQACACSLRGERFNLALDRVGSWHGNHILWTGLARAPSALCRLAEALGERLRAAGFALEERAFSPHVTLVRNARQAPPVREVDAIHWPVASFVLVASERTTGGAHYRVLGRWQLGARDTQAHGVRMSSN